MRKQPKINFRKQINNDNKIKQKPNFEFVNDQNNKKESVNNYPFNLENMISWRTKTTKNLRIFFRCFRRHIAVFTAFNITPHE